MTSRPVFERVSFSCRCGNRFATEVTVIACLDAGTDALTALLQGRLNRARCTDCGSESAVAIPVIVIDSRHEIALLLLGDAHRHRELEERAAAYTRLAAWREVPAFVRSLDVVFGPDALKQALAAGRDVQPVEAAQVLVVTPVPAPQPAAPARGSQAVAMGPRGDVVATASVSEADAARFQAGVEAIVGLHRMPTYPLVVLGVRAADVDRGPDSEHYGEPLWFPLDVAAARDCAVLDRLGQEFRLLVELQVSGRPPVRITAGGGREENVRLALDCAQAALGSVPALDHTRAVDAFLSSGYAREGERAHNLDESSFEDLRTAGATRIALMVTSHWLEPGNEEYLLLVRSFPGSTWRVLQRRVVDAALRHGVRLSTALTEFALAEGIAPTRADLVRRLLTAFAAVCETPSGSDLEPAEEALNWKLLLEDAEVVGVDVTERWRELAKLSSEQSRGRTEVKPPDRHSLGSRSIDDVVALLERKEARCEAAVELVERGALERLAEIFEAARKMTRGEVVRVLPALCSFGADTVPYFCGLLSDRRSYLRHGAALALGVLEHADAIEPLGQALVIEPTGVWREMARTLGKFGASFAHSVSTVSRGASPEGRERLAWAVAYAIAAGGASPAAIERLSRAGDGAAARVAARALEPEPEARAIEEAARAPRHDETVVSGFTRRFFDALEGEVDEDPDILEVADIEQPLDSRDILEESEVED